MVRKYLLILFISFTSLSFKAQELIQAKLLDSTSLKPIPFATVTINNNTGVISNDNGVFKIYLNKKTTGKDSLFINCLGYTTKAIAINKFTDSIITLHQKSIELNEVLISNTNYSVDVILEKINENLATNYNNNNTKSKLFYRESYFNNFIKNDVKIEESTIPEINQKIVDSVLTHVLPKKSSFHTEILGNLYKKTPNDIYKLDIIKASNLYDKNNKISFDGLKDKINTIFINHIKRNSYFKIKSGWFSAKQDIDSSFFGNQDNNKAIAQTKSFIEEEQTKNKDFLVHKKTAIAHLTNNSFIQPDSFLNFLKKNNRYHFELLDYILIKNNFVYKINFTPKRKEDFKGIIYVNADDFAIVRIDYENTKPLKKFNLLGISYRETLKKGTFIYYKNLSNKYTLKYAVIEMGNKIGIKRPLTIIEKNKHTKGRRKQNEISSDIHFIISNLIKKELVIFNNTTITENTFDNFIEKAKATPTYLPKYDPDFWKGYNVIEPNQAIKNFKSINP